MSKTYFDMGRNLKPGEVIGADYDWEEFHRIVREHEEIFAGLTRRQRFEIEYVNRLLSEALDTAERSIRPTFRERSEG